MFAGTKEREDIHIHNYVIEEEKTLSHDDDHVGNTKTTESGRREG
jgi:hypothetical protein